MKNYWITDKIVAKGHPFWTFEVYDNNKDIICETIVSLNNRKSVRVIEQLENNVWKPTCIIWNRIKLTFNNQRFIEEKGHLVLDVDGNQTGILKRYDKHGEIDESWTIHNIKLRDIEHLDKDSLKVSFSFHHAVVN